ncbi:hypothetical protein PBY51_016087 [Eleginops maclovinus]|uniref:Uncharacterized protein n=1 Tax=Eleginops maclovinus TaxID=56733 RepID=A0AAN8AJG8_ELEMC|nr:hypothetical protein PBY51_016087 [Eleginops maclovinus]
MRPRSRLLSKRRLLLPTIREGSEEMVRDLNEANTIHISAHGQAVSSEDYLLSICHLAHPTFPTREVSPDNIHRRLRLSRLSVNTSSTLEFNPTEEAREMQQREEMELYDELMFGNSDPLECLYGHQSSLSGGVRRAFGDRRYIRHNRNIWEGQARSRAYSIPHDSSPDLLHQRKSSCPELHTGTTTSISPEHCFPEAETRRGLPADGGTEEERQNPSRKQSLISQWISDCRTAWREARVRACMLPAIAEI